MGACLGRGRALGWNRMPWARVLVLSFPSATLGRWSPVFVPLRAPPAQAAWYDFANFRADKVFQERRAEWGKRGSEWVVRGTVRAKAMDGEAL